MDEPALRAAFFGQIVGALEELPPDVAAGARAAAGEGVLEHVANADRLEWIPLARLLPMSVTVLAEAGAEGVHQWGLRACLRAMRDPLFRAFEEAARAQHPGDPQGLLAFVCQAVLIHARGVGRFSTTPVARGVARVLQQPLAPQLRGPEYVLLIAGMLEAFPRAWGAEAQARVASAPLAETAEYLVRWEAPPKR